MTSLKLSKLIACRVFNAFFLCSSEIQMMLQLLLPPNVVVPPALMLWEDPEVSSCGDNGLIDKP